MKEKIILEDSPEAATYQTGIEGWVDATGRFWGKDEHMARYNGSTHKQCECGNIFKKHAYCEPCHQKRQDEKYAALERVEWDGESPVVTFDGDIYFFNGMEELLDYCDDHDCKIEDLKLCHAHPIDYPTIDIDDFFQDILSWDTFDRDTEDIIPQNIQNKIAELNQLLENAPPVSWECSDVAVKFKGETMISTTIYSERYRKLIGKRWPIKYAEISHEYPCCDIPTNKMCHRCHENFPCLLRRKPKVYSISKNRKGHEADWFLTTAYGMALADSTMHYSLRNEIMRPLRKFFKEKPFKPCLLPGCKNKTTHNGGYCCAEHCKQHVEPRI